LHRLSNFELVTHRGHLSRRQETIALGSVCSVLHLGQITGCLFRS
jgi:hypothetical protein